MLYRIITEDKNRDNICQIVSQFFYSFTVYPATGYWQDTQELSLIIEIDTLDGDSENTRLHIIAIATSIKLHNIQQAVLVQQIKSDSRLI